MKFTIHIQDKLLSFYIFENEKVLFKQSHIFASEKHIWEIIEGQANFFAKAKGETINLVLSYKLYTNQNFLESLQKIINQFYDTSIHSRSEIEVITNSCINLNKKLLIANSKSDNHILVNSLNGKLEGLQEKSFLRSTSPSNLTELFFKENINTETQFPLLDIIDNQEFNKSLSEAIETWEMVEDEDKTDFNISLGKLYQTNNNKINQILSNIKVSDCYKVFCSEIDYYLDFITSHFHNNPPLLVLKGILYNISFFKQLMETKSLEVGVNTLFLTDNVLIVDSNKDFSIYEKDKTTAEIQLSSSNSENYTATKHLTHGNTSPIFIDKIVFPILDKKIEVSINILPQNKAKKVFFNPKKMFPNIVTDYTVNGVPFKGIDLFIIIDGCKNIYMKLFTDNKSSYIQL